MIPLPTSKTTLPIRDQVHYPSPLPNSLPARASLRQRASRPSKFTHPPLPVKSQPTHPLPAWHPGSDLTHGIATKRPASFLSCLLVAPFISGRSFFSPQPPLAPPHHHRRTPSACPLFDLLPIQAVAVLLYKLCPSKFVQILFCFGIHAWIRNFFLCQIL